MGRSPIAASRRWSQSGDGPLLTERTRRNAKPGQSEGVEPKFTKVTLSGPGGSAVPLGAAKTEPSNQAVLIVPISKPLSAGVYMVHWQAVSVDTHHTQGTFEFTVKP